MEQVVINEVYEVQEYDKVKRIFSDDDFDIVFFFKGKEVMRIQGIPTNEQNRYVFTDGTVFEDDKGFGADYAFINDQWVKVRYSKKEFMLWCGVEKMMALNTAITAGNALVETVKDLLMAADYIDLRDPDTIHMVYLLASTEGGNILSGGDAARILAGEVYQPE